MRTRIRNALPQALLVFTRPFSLALGFSALSSRAGVHATGQEDKAASRKSLPWILVGGYILALYSTLPVMPRIWNELNNILGGKGLWAIYAATGALLLALLWTMAARGVRSGLAYLAYALFCFLLLSLGALENNPGEKIHMLQYALLGVLLRYAFSSRLSRSHWLRPLLTGALICILAGALDEIIQYLLPNRSFTWHDVFVNGASGVLTLCLLIYCLPGLRDSVNGGRRKLPKE